MTNAEKLISIRKAIGWNQAQMAGALNLDRSYLSMLESGRRPASDPIVKKAEQVMWEARRLTPAPVLADLEKFIARSPTWILLSVAEHFLGQRGKAPEHIDLFYRFISSIVTRELTHRIDKELQGDKRPRK